MKEYVEIAEGRLRPFEITCSLIEGYRTNSGSIHTMSDAVEAAAAWQGQGGGIVGVMLSPVIFSYGFEGNAETIKEPGFRVHGNFSVLAVTTVNDVDAEAMVRSLAVYLADTFRQVHVHYAFDGRAHILEQKL